jgi:uncharacterized membrane protein
MSQNVEPGRDTEITDNDKLMALLAYIIGIIVPLIILLSDSNKRRPFQRYHAVQSLILSAVIFVAAFIIICPLSLLIGFLSAGIGSACTFPIGFLPYIVAIYYGIEAYQGKYSVIPVITDFAKKQGWV